MQVNLHKKKILITGGTGSVGKVLIKKLLKDFPSVGGIIVFSRDEFKQSELSRKYKDKPLKFIIGDVRDESKLLKEFSGVDYVFHAAAMKYLDICENNPEEAYKTNVLGTKNVIAASIANQVERVIFISTDKVADAISEYGRSKAEAENLIVEASQQSTTQFTILRLGNIFNSRGSVFEVFKEQSKTKTLTLFDKRSTRYLITKSQLFKSLIYVITHSFNSMVIIPKLPVFSLIELAKVYGKDCKIEELEVRKGERIHEFLFSKDELNECYEDNKYYYIFKPGSDKATILKIFKMQLVNLEQPVSSETGNFLTAKDLEILISSKKKKVKTSS